MLGLWLWWCWSGCVLISGLCLCCMMGLLCCLLKWLRCWELVRLLCVSWCCGFVRLLWCSLF